MNVADSPEIRAFISIGLPLVLGVILKIIISNRANKHTFIKKLNVFLIYLGLGVIFSIGALNAIRVGAETGNSLPSFIENNSGMFIFTLTGLVFIAITVLLSTAGALLFDNVSDQFEKRKLFVSEKKFNKSKKIASSLIVETKNKEREIKKLSVHVHDLRSSIKVDTDSAGSSKSRVDEIFGKIKKQVMDEYKLGYKRGRNDKIQKLLNNRDNFFKY